MGANDRENNRYKQQPIEGATIVMQLPDSTYLGAAISAADGTFTLEQEPDSYLLIIQHPTLSDQTDKGEDNRCRYYYFGSKRLQSGRSGNQGRKTIG